MGTPVAPGVDGMKGMQRTVSAVSLLALTMVLAGCSDEGPVESLSDESLRLTLPSSLEAWPTEPGDSYWQDAEMEDGRDALLHVSPRGGGGAMAWAETGWRMVPFPPPSVRSACEVFLELVAVNMQSGTAAGSSRAATTKCIKVLRPGEDIERSWPITLGDGAPAQLRVTMRSLQDPDDYWVNISMAEQ